MNTMIIILLISLLCVSRIVSVFALEALCLTKWASTHLVYPPRPIPNRRREAVTYIFGVLMEGGLLFLLLHFCILQLNPFSLWSLPVLVVVFGFVVEPIYYIYHRLLHTKFLYTHYHIHHHKTVVPKPLSAFYFTLTERLSYTLLFFIPLYVLSSCQLLSRSLLFIYIVVFDIVNALGHTNLKLFSEKYEKSVWHLFFYSPHFHSDHHKYFRTNYSLFMPLWDKLFKSYRS